MATVYKRGRVWWVRFQHQGVEVRRSAGTAVKAKAVRFLGDLLEEYDRLGKGGRPRKTFNEAMARFHQEHLPTMRPQAAYRYLVSTRALLRHFDGVYLDELTKTRLGEFVTARKAAKGKAGRRRVSDTTIRRDLACLSSMLTSAVNWEWLDHNPVRGFDKRSIPEGASRVRFLSPDEYAALIVTAPEPFRTMITVDVETGLRLGELLALKRADVDHDRMEIRVADSKTGQPRRVPMSETASAQIRAHPARIGTKLLFSRPDGTAYTVADVSKRFGKIVKVTGIENLRFHDLRHTFASWAVQRGSDLYRIGRILGHKGPQMTMRYAHLRTQDLREVVNRPGTKPGTEERDLGGEGVDK